VNSDQKNLKVQIDRATERLLSTVKTFTNDDPHAPSLLPGWTRGHVLTHIARSADALRALMLGAQSGIPAPGYASQEARAADIEAGAGRNLAALLEDIVHSAAEFWSQAAALTEETWQTPVKILDYQPFPLSQVLLRRLVEIELHHVDLGAGYRPADWPPEFADLDLPEPMRSQRNSRLELGER
jgi:maleylpyruvate isomerase